MSTKTITKKSLKDFASFEQLDTLKLFQQHVKPCSINEKQNKIDVGLITHGIHNGEKCQIMKCSRCGKISVSQYFSYNETKCLHCGTALYLLNVGSSLFNANIYEHYVFITYHKQIDSYVLAFISRNYTHSHKGEHLYIENGENEFFDAPILSNDTVDALILFNKDFGFFSIKQNEFKRTFYTYAIDKHNIVVGDTYAKEITDILIDEFDKNPKVFHNLTLLDNAKKSLPYNFVPSIKPYNNIIDKKRAKEVSKTSFSYTIRSIDDIVKECSAVINNVFCSQGFMYDFCGISKDSVTINAYCQCGHHFQKEIHQKVNSMYERINVSEKCPQCNMIFDSSLSLSSSKHFTHLEFLHYEKIDSENVLLRYFIIEKKIENGRIITNINEKRRYLFTEKKIFYYIKDDKTDDFVVINRCNKYDLNYTINCHVVNTKEELEEIINTSFFSKTGVLHAWGLGSFSDYKIEEIGRFFYGSFLHSWYSKPYIETTIKGKLLSLTKNLMHMSYEKSYNKKNIYEMFGITKSALKIIRDKDLSLNQVTILKSCLEIEPGLTIELWNELTSFEEYVSDISIKYLIECCQNNDISIRRMLDYLQSCYDNQCIIKSNALSIYADYLRMAKKIGFNLEDKYIKFPSSLKKEHDKAIFAYKVVEDDLKKKEFIEKSIINKKYEYENDSFIVIVPMSPDEVIHEGQVQKHCVASYVDRIQKGETCVCFLRKKECVEKEYFTCEIYQDTIWQVKGYCNYLPNKYSDAELIKFIDDWAKKKGLKTEYTRH